MNGLAYLGAVGVTGRLARLLLQFSLAILLSNTSITFAQNHVLQLDGKGSYVELPPDVLRGLEAATVEAWVKWEVLDDRSDVFDFGSDQVEPSQDMLVGIRDGALQFKINNPEAAQRDLINARGLVRAGEWFHFAAVSGPGGMKLYFNGVLAGTHDYPGSFKAIQNDDFNLLGRDTAHATQGQPDFRGQMDEFRVWTG